MRENHQNSAARFVFFFTVFHRSKDRKDLIWSNFLFVRLWVCLLLSFLFFLFPLQSFERFQSKRIVFFSLYSIWCFEKRVTFVGESARSFFLLFLLNRKRKSLFAFISQCIYTNERFALRRDFCLFIYFTSQKAAGHEWERMRCECVSEWVIVREARKARACISESESRRTLR